MFRKPFRTPFLKETASARATVEEDYEPQLKKRRISGNHKLEATKVAPRLIFTNPGVSCLPRKPLLAVQNPAFVVEGAELDNGAIEGYYNVLW